VIKDSVSASGVKNHNSVGPKKAEKINSQQEKKYLGSKILIFLKFVPLNASRKHDTKHRPRRCCESSDGTGKARVRLAPQLRGGGGWGEQQEE